jgi:hypothetical protein
MTQHLKKYIFAGKTFEESTVGKYYNLNTHRFISKAPKNSGQDFYLLQSPRIAGYSNQIVEFFNTNHLAVPEEFIAPQVEQKVPVKVDPLSLTGSIAKAIASIPPLGTLMPIITSIICKKTGSVILSDSSTKVEEISYGELDTLCNFSFNGLTTKARMMYLVDGDTFDLAFFCPLDIFTRKLTEGKKQGPRAILNTNTNEAGMFVKRRCRLYGLDAAEHNTVRGPIATQLFKDYTLKDGNEKEWYVYIQCFGDDKYGRLLVKIYEDPQFSKPLEDKLLAYQHSDYGAVYNSYYGKTKQTFPSDVVPQAIYPIQPLI